MSAPTMSSHTRQAGIFSKTSSYAVNLDPWLYGRVSVQKAFVRRPLECSARMTPRAVP